MASIGHDCIRDRFHGFLLRGWSGNFDRRLRRQTSGHEQHLISERALVVVHFRAVLSHVITAALAGRSRRGENAVRRRFRSITFPARR